MNISNAKAVILNQQAEWARIMSDESDRQSLLRYGLTLMLVAYALMFVVTALVSMAISTVVPFSAFHAVMTVVVQFALAVASLYFVPQILAMVAPSFGGKNDSLSALKLYVFAGTPAWLGMSIAIIPVLGWLVALAGGIFGLYLFWLHVAEAMSVPEDKKIGYVVVSILVIAVVQIVIGAVGNGIANMVAPYPGYHIGL